VIVKVKDDVFTYFHAVAKNAMVVYGINCLACQDRFSVNNSLDVKEIMRMFSILLLTCLAFFGLGEFGLSVYGSHFL
jgi:multisubunit Na+/H+ antiporter MnhG subunit